MGRRSGRRTGALIPDGIPDTFGPGGRPGLPAPVTVAALVLEVAPAGTGGVSGDRWGNLDRLADDHANAQRLAEGLRKIPGVSIDRDKVDMNMFFITLSAPGTSAKDVSAKLREQDILCGAAKDGSPVMRLVTVRTSWGDWVESHTSNDSARGCHHATMPRVSMGTGR